MLFFFFWSRKNNTHENLKANMNATWALPYQFAVVRTSDAEVEMLISHFLRFLWAPSAPLGSEAAVDAVLWSSCHSKYVGILHRAQLHISLLEMTAKQTWKWDFLEFCLFASSTFFFLKSSFPEEVQLHFGHAKIVARHRGGFEETLRATWMQENLRDTWLKVTKVVIRSY